MHKGNNRRYPGNQAFYTLPNGRRVTLEQIVLYEPLDALFQYGVMEFSILDIQMTTLYKYNILLSHKQVRDALYRVSHGKLILRHIGRGFYTWAQKCR